MKYKKCKGMTLVEMMIAIIVFGLVMLASVRVLSTYIKNRNSAKFSQQGIEELALMANDMAKRIRMSNCENNGCEFTSNKKIVVTENTSAISRNLIYEFTGYKLKRSLDGGAGEEALLDIDGEFHVVNTGADEIPLVTVKMWKYKDKNNNGSIESSEKLDETTIQTSVSMRSGYTAE